MTSIDLSSFLFIVLCFPAGLFLLWFSFTKKEVLLSVATSVVWMGIAYWIFTTMDMTLTWAQFLIWVAVMLIFVPLLALMNTELKVTRDGNSWTEYGGKPPKNIVSASEKYKREIHGILSNARSNRRGR